MKGKLGMVERALREAGYKKEAAEIRKAGLLQKPVSNRTASLAAKVLRNSGEFSTATRNQWR